MRCFGVLTWLYDAGEIPASLGQLTNLTQLSLKGNQLSGEKLRPPSLSLSLPVSLSLSLSLYLSLFLLVGFSCERLVSPQSFKINFLNLVFCKVKS